MKVKTSITLTRALLAEIDRQDKNRSAFLERAAMAYLAQISKDLRDRRDARLINRHAARLNKEAADILEYQSAIGL